VIEPITGEADNATTESNGNNGVLPKRRTRKVKHHEVGYIFFTLDIDILCKIPENILRPTTRARLVHDTPLPMQA
jgi:hypothetical protein